MPLSPNPDVPSFEFRSVGPTQMGQKYEIAVHYHRASDVPYAKAKILRQACDVIQEALAQGEWCLLRLDMEDRYYGGYSHAPLIVGTLEFGVVEMGTYRIAEDYSPYTWYIEENAPVGPTVKETLAELKRRWRKTWARRGWCAIFDWLEEKQGWT